MDKSSSLGMPMSPPRNIQEVQASKLGDAQGIPFFINKIIRSSLKTLFLLIHILCVILGASVIFAFSFVLFCLLQFIVGSQLILFGERHAPFSLSRTLQFSLLLFCVFTFCQYYVQLLFSTRILFRACWFDLVSYDQLSGLS